MNLSLSKAVLPWAALPWPLLVWQAGLQQAGSPAVAPFRHFAYSRAVTLKAGQHPSPYPDQARSQYPSQACAVLDEEVFAHAAPSLKDLRLYRSAGSSVGEGAATEVPYAITVSEPQQQESDEARILDRSVRSGHIVFDLEMPHRPYTGVTLDLAARDFVAAATVSGSARAASRKATPLGVFTLFDLTSQRLSHSTSIPLSESTFPYLHIDLVLLPAPGSPASAGALNAAATVRAATVPPSREAQTLFRATQRSGELLQQGGESVATFQVPKRVPVERIAFTLQPGYKGSFSRAVRIVARGVADEGHDAQAAGAAAGSAPFRSEEASGSILHVRKTEGGRELLADVLSVPIAIGSNMQQPAIIVVTVENGHDAPLPIRSVELQMRQRRICFDAADAQGPLKLFYGGPSLEAPAYEATQAASNPRIAKLGAEAQNPGFVGTTPLRQRRQRPVLRWVALLGGVCLFALLVIRSAKKAAHR